MGAEPTLTDQLDRVTVQLHGVPLGALSLEPGELVLASLEPWPAYAAVAGSIRAASEQLWRDGFLHPGSTRVAIESLAPQAEHPFELRDLEGRVLEVDFVNVVASPRELEPPVVVVYRKRVHAAIASIVGEGSRNDRSANE